MDEVLHDADEGECPGSGEGFFIGKNSSDV
jgi:hypothetical protein